MLTQKKIEKWEDREREYWRTERTNKTEAPASRSQCLWEAYPRFPFCFVFRRPPFQTHLPSYPQKKKVESNRFPACRCPLLRLRGEETCFRHSEPHLGETLPPRAMINETATAGPVWRRLCVALSRGLLKEAVLGQRRLMWKLATKRRRSAEELLLWTQL